MSEGDDEGGPITRILRAAIGRLIVHRLASEPRSKRRSWGDGEDRRILRTTCAALLDLHFAISGERVEVPTDGSHPAGPT